MRFKHAGAVIIKDQKVLLIKRAKFEESEPDKWCMVNETLEEGELPTDAVIRGVKEEMGLNFIITKELFEHTYGEHLTYIFLGEVTGDITPHPEEVADFDWFNYGEAMELECAYGYDEVLKKILDLGLITP
jgi:ADP-ribose pyrophosphatase YjhB (NUDIX family)